VLEKQQKDWINVGEKKREAHLKGVGKKVEISINLVEEIHEKRNNTK
jgi:hypothetical protein